ncbi:hypothetical protein J2T08_004070 [Neorhizobium galegae]|uniref:hypothetical protein n=1 Tax=Neorhizobium galegae TaxID=399 RepID=UPI001AE96A5E|nr:hypothetical protein [Neorhizobium galegae]MBP2557908.1 hypothetical protein [Neorhizobium galegae]MDQ0136134.1 hypothetical protein [Neorhizobium galegae]
MPDIYRIVRPPTVVVTADGKQEQPSRAREIAERAIRLIPGDVLVIYASIRAIFAPSDMARLAEDAVAYYVINWVLPIGCLVLTALLRIWGTPRPGATLKDVQWPVVLIASAAYCGWLLSQGGPLLGFSSVDSRIGMALLFLFGALPPFIYSGSKQ